MKFVFLFWLSFAVNSAWGQQTPEVSSEPFRPYVAPGVLLSSGQVSYAVEPGLYTPKVWFGLPLEYTIVNDSTQTLFAGLKLYYRAARLGNKTDLFVYGAPKVQVNSDALPLVFEPGALVVTNLSDVFALWASFSTTFYENETPFVPAYFGSGAGVMFSF